MNAAIKNVLGSLLFRRYSWLAVIAVSLMAGLIAAIAVPVPVR